MTLLSLHTFKSASRLALLTGGLGLCLISGRAMSAAEEGGKPSLYTGNANQADLENRLKTFMADQQGKTDGTGGGGGGGGRRNRNGGQGGQGQNGGKDKQEEAEYKEKVAMSVERISQEFELGEQAFKDEQYRIAASHYSSVILSNLPSTEKNADKARGRILEMEGLAKSHLGKADDADLGRDYMKEVVELSIITKEFPFTQAYQSALRRLTTLKNRPDVAGSVELAEAEAQEANGQYLKASKGYQSIVDNEHYKNTLPALRAKRHLDEMKTNEASRENLKKDVNAQADVEGPKLIAAGNNFILNKMPAKAKEKFNTVIEKYPGTKYADEAKKQLETMP